MIMELLEEEFVYDWDFSCQMLLDNMAEIKDDDLKENMRRRYAEFFNLAKKRPIDRTPLFSSIKGLLVGLTEDFGDSYNS